MLRLLPHPPPPYQQHHTTHHNDHQHRNHHERNDGPVVLREVEADAHIDETESDGEGPEDAVADHELRGLGAFAVDEVAGEAEGPGCHDEEEDEESENLVGVAEIVLLQMEHVSIRCWTQRKHGRKAHGVDGPGDADSQSNGNDDEQRGEGLDTGMCLDFLEDSQDEVSEGVENEETPNHEQRVRDDFAGCVPAPWSRAVVVIIITTVTTRGCALAQDWNTSCTSCGDHVKGEAALYLVSADLSIKVVARKTPCRTDSPDHGLRFTCQIQAVAAPGSTASTHRIDAESVVDNAAAFQDLHCYIAGVFGHDMSFA